LHGLAADMAVNSIAMESLLASEVNNTIGAAIRTLF
jgi:hypothetical protein